MAIRDPRIRRPRSGPIPRRREPLHDYETYSADSGAPPLPRPDERREIALWSGLNVLAGAWLVIAPWVLGYWTSDPRWNEELRPFALINATEHVEMIGRYQQRRLCMGCG